MRRIVERQREWIVEDRRGLIERHTVFVEICRRLARVPLDARESTRHQKRESRLYTLASTAGALGRLAHAAFGDPLGLNQIGMQVRTISPPSAAAPATLVKRRVVAREKYRQRRDIAGERSAQSWSPYSSSSSRLGRQHVFAIDR